MVPISLCFSTQLVLSNYSYLYISIAYIQILKAFIPCINWSLSIAFGLANWEWRIPSALAIITCGIVLATGGERNFSLLGFGLQLGAIFVNAGYMVLGEVLLKQKGNRPPPLRQGQGRWQACGGTPQGPVAEAASGGWKAVGDESLAVTERWRAVGGRAGVGGCANDWAPRTRKRRHKEHSSGRQNALARRIRRRGGRVAVQGPAKKLQPDGMSHGGDGLGWSWQVNKLRPSLILCSPPPPPPKCPTRRGRMGPAQAPPGGSDR